MIQFMKKVKAYEQKIEKLKTKQNVTLSDISGLKDEVNLMRRERVIYDSVFKKLELDLKVKEEELKRQIREAINVEHDRQEIIDELTSVMN